MASIRVGIVALAAALAFSGCSDSSDPDAGDATPSAGAGGQAHAGGVSGGFANAAGASGSGTAGTTTNTAGAAAIDAGAPAIDAGISQQGCEGPPVTVQEDQGTFRNRADRSRAVFS